MIAIIAFFEEGLALAKFDEVHRGAQACSSAVIES
jgi:hypothetical protein